jgi:uncharacterized protein (DUF1501 family)
MKTDNKNKPLSRRGFLGAGMLLPFLSVTKPLAAEPASEQVQDNEFITMLTAEGKTVKVRKNAVKDAKVIEKKMSNQSLLNWLKPKGFSK